MNQRNFRKIHRQIAPILFLPLLITALTGIGYRIGKSWLGMTSENAKIFMNIHQGGYLGNTLKPIYILLVGVGLLGMIVTGLIMSKFWQTADPKPAKSLPAFRQFHRIFAPIIFLPLTLSAFTGIFYRIGKTWFGMSSEQAEIFMAIHQGDYFGNFGKVIYVLLVGVGLIAMLGTGIKMTGILRQRRPQA